MDALNPFDDYHIIDSHENVFSAEMAYLMPYTRLKSRPSSGMQLTTVKRNEHQERPSTDAVNLVTGSSLVSSKTIQKLVLNQPFKPIEFSPPKMSKKNLKLAQDQLKKLSKINIHLHGTYDHFISFLIEPSQFLWYIQSVCKIAWFSHYELSAFRY